MRSLIAIFTLALIGNANAMSSSDLLTYCNNRPTADNMLDYSVCAAYIGGAIEMAEMIHGTQGVQGQEKQFCLPTGKVDASSNVDFWLAHMRNNPNQSYLPAAFTVFFAISSKYPCE